MTDKQTITLDGVSTREMVNDVVSITFTSSKEGKVAEAVQVELREAVRTALEQIRPFVKDEEVEVTTDSFQVQARYSGAGKMNGYVGVASVTIKGTDTATIAKLATDVKTMAVSGSRNSVSRKAKLEIEAELMEAAIADFRSKADAITKAFGYKSWEINSASVSVSGDRTGGMGKVMSLGGSAGIESAAMEIESGKSTMTGNVRGTISLSRTKKS